MTYIFLCLIKLIGLAAFCIAFAALIMLFAKAASFLVCPIFDWLEDMEDKHLNK